MIYTGRTIDTLAQVIKTYFGADVRVNEFEFYQAHANDVTMRQFHYAAIYCREKN